MNYRDVAVLNDSLDSLSSNLLKQKMLREQAIERQAQTGLASQRLATDQAFREAQQKHYNNMESKQAEAANLAQTRAQIADKSGTLRAIMQLNTAGQLSDVTPVNDWLSTDPHFAPTGIQLRKSEKPLPQAGQNSAAQLAQQRNLWFQKVKDATTDEDRAEAQSTYDVLDKVFNQLAEPKPAKPDRSIEVETSTPVPGSTATDKTKRKFSPQEFQDYQARQPKGKPTKAIAQTYVQKYGSQSAALDALKKDGYDPS